MKNNLEKFAHRIIRTKHRYIKRLLLDGSTAAEVVSELLAGLPEPKTATAQTQRIIMADILRPEIQRIQNIL